MKRACLLLLPAVAVLALGAVGCNDESKPKITRVKVSPACGVVPLQVEAFAIASGGDETGDPLGGNNNLEMNWTFGDGGTGSTSLAYHRYDVAGDYSVTVVATDPAGNVAAASIPVSVLADSLIVAATSNFPGGVVSVTDTVQFFVSATSCDVDYPTIPGDAVKMTFLWRMNDAASTTFRGPTPRFVFTTPGVYDVQVAVTYPAWAVTRHRQIQLTVNP